eukprot:scaffold610_cov352-Pavlova_lutheri.AAC.20
MISSIVSKRWRAGAFLSKEAILMSLKSSTGCPKIEPICVVLLHQGVLQSAQFQPSQSAFGMARTRPASKLLKLSFSSALLYM